MKRPFMSVKIGFYVRVDFTASVLPYRYKISTYLYLFCEEK